MSDASYEHVSWDYSEEDLIQVDRLCNEILDGASCISTQIDEVTDKSVKNVSNVNKTLLRAPLNTARSLSPSKRFRKSRGYLSVSDIVGPIWCELQYEYGLYQQRQRPLSRRPTSFTTVSGKEIHVQTDVAQRNDAILTKGKAVHKKLEEEIHKDEIPIRVSSEEEKWALTLLNFLSKLVILRESHICREIPVWGIIQDQPLFGIIDELRLVNKSKTLTFSMNSKPLETAKCTGENVLKGGGQQLTLNSFFVPSTPTRDSGDNMAKIKDGTGKQTDSDLEICIYDNKTRYKKTLPSHADTLPSRIQLMLYHCLLQRVLSADALKEDNFKAKDTSLFSTFCTRLGSNVNIFQEFSDEFKSEMKMAVELNGLSYGLLDAVCIKDMDFPAQETINNLGFNIKSILSDKLFLAYRHRGWSKVEQHYPDPSKAMRQETGSEMQFDFHQPTRSVVDVGKDQDTQDSSDKVSAISIKLKSEEPLSISDNSDAISDTLPPRIMKTRIASGKGPQLDLSKLLTEEIKFSSAEMMIPSSNNQPSNNSKNDNDTLLASATMKSSAPMIPTPAVSEPASGALIGTKKFFHREDMVMNHLKSILQWWNGERLSVGVDIENISRCNSCEYANGCEWREGQALKKKV